MNELRYLIFPKTLKICIQIGILILYGIFYHVTNNNMVQNYHPNNNILSCNE
jgi:hypothetical protein